MKSSRVYLDHAGSALASESQLAAIGRDLLQMRLSNPHSRHPTSVRTRDIIDRARNRILRHFNTTSDHFSVVFTLNATQALKMVAECFQFGEHQRDSEITSNLESCPDGVFVYMRDAHTSVVGMRELARHRCNRVCAIDFDALYDLPAGQLNETENHSRDLFVITAMSNFCGRKYPLHIIERIHKWRPGQSFVCLDAASWVSTSFLDLSIYKPDFIAISFYKIFGYPTGVGALLVRNECCYLLQKQYFGGGTVNLADHSHFRVHRKVDFVESLEDGTMDFYGIAALERGFEDIDSYGGIKAVQQKTFALASRAFRALSTRIHLNGRRIAEIYCADSDYGSSETQGPIVAFNLLRDDGSYVGYTEVEEVCDLFGIELRSGCFCNQGACQMYLRIPHEQLIANYESEWSGPLPLSGPLHRLLSSSQIHHLQDCRISPTTQTTAARSTYDSTDTKTSSPKTAQRLMRLRGPASRSRSWTHPVTFTNHILPKSVFELCYDDTVKKLKELFRHNTSAFTCRHTYLKIQRNGESLSDHTEMVIRRHEFLNIRQNATLLQPEVNVVATKKSQQGPAFALLSLRRIALGERIQLHQDDATIANSRRINQSNLTESPDQWRYNPKVPRGWSGRTLLSVKDWIKIGRPKLMPPFIKLESGVSRFVDTSSAASRSVSTKEEESATLWVPSRYLNGKVCGDSIDIIDKRPVGALRISFGRQSSEYDVEMFERLLDACFVSSPSLRVPLKSGVISEPTLTNIFIYPVKSCSSIKVERWQVGTSGFQYDRQWMIISAGGTVLSQKRYPLLCLIQPQIENGKLILMKKGNRTDNCYAEVPLRIRGGASPESRRICVHRVQTVDCGDEVAEWIDAELGENGCRLHRVCDQRSTSSSNDCGFGIASLSNEAPYLLINRRSANYLAEMVGLKLEEVIKRFRANLIVDGIEPFVEDNITTISIGGVVGKCSRCQMICIDQESGKKEANLLLALRDYRLGSKTSVKLINKVHSFYN
uniref:MOSC domain-containing protein n=1 Tax=Toxocara canis TaxID=6265 RepID=A0A183UN95_TOXCA